jgi:hypothetical protein
MSAGSAPPQANGTVGGRLGGLVPYVPLIWLDILAPVLLVVLYAATG